MPESHESSVEKHLRLKKQPFAKLVEIQSRAPAEPPRKLLRVHGLGDKLGYLQATFVPPSIFSDQP